MIEIPIVDMLSPRPPYLPLAIPRDLSERMIRLHGDPTVWWIGQFMKYLLRYQPETQAMLDEAKETMNFRKPIVGYIIIVTCLFSCCLHLKLMPTVFTLMYAGYTYGGLTRWGPKLPFIPSKNTCSTLQTISINWS